MNLLGLAQICAHCSQYCFKWFSLCVPEFPTLKQAFRFLGVFQRSSLVVTSCVMNVMPVVVG